MAVFNVEKVVSALPDPLSPNTLYYVRVGAGFDLYLSDSTGTIAHKLNADRSLTKATLGHSAGAIAADVSSADWFEFEAEAYNEGGVTVVGATKTLVNNDAAFDLPAGLVEGDVVFYSGMDYPSVPNPTGYTSLGHVTLGGGIYGRASYKVMGAVPDSEITGLNAYHGNALALRGIDPAVLDAAIANASDTSTGSNSDIDPAQVTTVTDKAMSLVAIFGEVQPTQPQNPIEGAAMVGYVERIAATYEFSSSFHYTSSFHSKEIVTAGVENPPVLDGGGHRLWAAMTIPIRPAPPSGVKDYTLTLTNKPASVVKPIRIILDVKTTAGSWDVSTIDEWIGGAPNLNVVGKHALKIYANSGLTIAEYLGLVA
jgi:hypothetical protein